MLLSLLLFLVPLMLHQVLQELDLRPVPVGVEVVPLLLVLLL